jgi:lipopolysaccharide export system ATP-binding protein
MLEACGLRKNYGKRPVVRGVDLTVGAGEVVGLLGPNGAGKTTTFHMLVGLLLPTAGHVMLDGTDITSLPLWRRARSGIGYLPQEPSIFRRLTVRQNLIGTAELLPLEKWERRELVEKFLSQLALEHLADNFALTLSGGERRRLEIARALIGGPKYLLLDEPFSGVDPINVQEVQGIIRRIRNQGIGVLITDHSVRETLAAVDRAYLIHDGAVLLSGDRRQLLNDPLSKRFYLGENFSVNTDP